MRSKRKVWLVFIICILLFAHGSISSYAIDPITEESETIFSTLYDTLSPQIQEILHSIGLEELHYEALLTLSPQNVFHEFFKLITLKISAPFHAFLLIVNCLIFAAVLDHFFASDKKTEPIFSLFITFFSSLCIIKPVLESMTAAFSSMQITTAFLFSYIPLFTGLLAAYGKLLTSAAYSNLMLLLSNFLGIIDTKVFFPILQCVLVLNIVSGIQNNSFFSSISDFLKKATTMTLTFLSTLFSGLVAIQGNLAMAGDTVTMRSMKLLIGATVPIVGGNLSDACSSLLGSFLLIKNTMGGFSLLILAILFLPVTIDLLLWKIALNFLGTICESLQQSTSQRLFKGVSSTISFVLSILFFTAFVFIISTGILLHIKS